MRKLLIIVTVVFCALFLLSCRVDKNSDISELILKTENGDMYFQYKLANCYYYGDGVKKNIKKALKLTDDEELKSKILNKI